MNHQLLSSLTATLLITNLSATPSSYAESVDQVTNAEQANVVAVPVHSKQEPVLSATASTTPTVTPPLMGRQTSAIAEIHAHEFSGRRAATLYVRSIPVLTFLGATLPKEGHDSASAPSADTQLDNALQLSQLQDDPVWRAMSVAAQLNYLHQQQVSADSITVKWQSDTAKLATEQGNPVPGALSLAADKRVTESESASVPESFSFPTPSVNSSPVLLSPPAAPRNARKGHFLIQVEGRDLLVMDNTVILPDTTKDSAQDVLQITNRLRRLMGNASPLAKVEGLPVVQQQPLAYRQTLQRYTGMASWYGPGFHGSYSANGEVFNQYALTAAHPTLPFGTMVRVTNLNNGRSVVVRINDRGPYAGGRIIDLSKGAADAIGMIPTGVAQVNLEVLQ